MKTGHFIILFLLNFSIAFSQDFLFEHLRVEDGLSQSSVQAIYQDEFDNMWFATRDGFNKYDGNTIEVFRPIVGDTTGLFSNNIQTVCGDRKGHIYLRCLTGLVEYSLKKESMRIITRDGVECISYGKENLWVGFKNTISYLGQDKKIATYVKLEKDIKINRILEVKDGTLYVGTRQNGLFIIDKNKKIRSLIPETNIISIYEDAQSNIWIGTVENGIYQLDRQNNLINFLHNQNDKNTISDNYVRAICQDNFGNYWFGTFKGMNHYNPTTKTIIHFDHDEKDPYSLGSSSIWSIVKDAQGTLWIGTFFEGVDRINPEFSFSQYYRKDETGKGLSGSVVGNIAEDEQGNLWICTEDGGLNYFDRKTNHFSFYKSSPQNAGTIASNALKSIYLDKKNNCLWLGAHLGGLSRFDLKTGTNKRYSFSDPRFSHYVRCIQYRNDTLYLGTHNSVYVFDIKTETATPLLENKKFNLTNSQIWDMLIDGDDNLWFSTSFAVFRHCLKTNETKRYKHNRYDTLSLSTGYLNTFFESGKGKIWIGSAGGGINLYDKKSDTFTHFNTQNSSIIDDYILDINESPMGYLLIATNKGLSRFDYENNTFYNYYNNTFFPFSMINERGLHITKKGEVIISSVNGMLIINEKDLDSKYKKYRINLTELYVNNNLIKPEDENDILHTSLPYTKKITLNHRHSTFSINYNVTNYIKAIQPRIMYKLEGFDKHWVNTNRRNLINYTNLNPGNYKLIVKGDTDSADETQPITELEIEILPPFYATTIAYLIYFILSAIILYIAISNYASRIKLKSSLIYANKEKEQIEELNQSKLRFFTNISHEFRTPITLITAQLEVLLQAGNIPQNIYSRILNILKNTEKMKKLINELLDFRKQEQGFVKQRMSQINIIQFIQEIYLPFKEYAHSRHIELSFIYKEEDIEVWFDPNQFEKVFYNLLSNAFKYTTENGKIAIIVEKNVSTINITIKDSGIGIDKDCQDKIFDRFYQAETEQSSPFNLGTGIGLALVKGIVEAHKGKISVYSEIGRGSEFKISLLLGDSHFDEELKVKNEDPDRQAFSNAIIPEIEFIEEIKKSQLDLETGGKATMLIVEDNPELLQVLCAIFEPLYKTLTAQNGKEGFEITLKEQPEIVLTDVMMPVMSGTEMCRKIKNNFNTCHIPVVLLTARSAIEQTLEGLRTGADDYISKPFNTKILIARCNNLVMGRKLIQTKFSKSPEVETHMLATSTYDLQLLEKAITIIEANIDNPEFNVNDFAQEMCLGRTNLFSKLKGITGQTPNDFITSIRLKRSLVILKEEPHTSIAEISLRVGFNEAAYFVKRFKKVYGDTPAQYRKENL